VIDTTTAGPPRDANNDGVVLSSSAVNGEDVPQAHSSFAELYPAVFKRDMSLQQAIDSASMAVDKRAALRAAEVQGHLELAADGVDWVAVRDAEDRIATRPWAQVLDHALHNINDTLLNPSVLRSDYATDPEFDKLIRLATQGPAPITHADFQPNEGLAGRMRLGATATPTAILAHARKAQRKGHALLVRRKALAHLRTQRGARVGSVLNRQTQRPSRPLAVRLFQCQ